jgi:hypothetical protein
MTAVATIPSVKRNSPLASICSNTLKQGQVERGNDRSGIPLTVNNIAIGHLVVDFLVRYADGRRELVEITSPATITPLSSLKESSWGRHGARTTRISSLWF